MEYEEIWQKIKQMKQWERSMLAYEMTLKGFNVGYIHPHYYFDAKAIHDIVFYAPHKQCETEDEDGTYYKALKEIIENDKEIHVRVNRYALLPKFVNDWREGKIVRKYICSRINEDYVNALYRILPGKSLAGERPRSLFITLNNGEEMVYKMTECKVDRNTFFMTFQRS